MSTLFLDDDALRQLTGFSQKSRQVQQLRKMGVPFFVNAGGYPVVACSAVQGNKPTAAELKPKTPWVPRVLQKA